MDTRGQQKVTIFLVGAKQPAIDSAFNSPPRVGGVLVIGGNAQPGGSLEERIDEFAVYDRALPTREIVAQFKEAVSEAP